jgi:metal-sulfur cluster biosynthetic enzyme
LRRRKDRPGTVDDDGSMTTPPITETALREALRQVIDPELGINIVDLGLVYGIDIQGTRVRLSMTMTTPACPLAEYLKALVFSALEEHVPGVEDLAIDLVWDPPWTEAMMSAAAYRQLTGRDR